MNRNAAPSSQRRERVIVNQIVAQPAASTFKKMSRDKNGRKTFKRQSDPQRSLG